MNKFVKKLLVGILAGTMLLGSVATSYAATSPVVSPTKPVTEAGVKADKNTKTGITSTVNTSKNGTAKITAVAKTAKTSVTIASTVKVDGVSYKVTAISAKAFAKCTKAKTVTLPATITTIGSKAFTGAKALKTIKINSKKVTVSKTAFKGVNTKKMTIQLPAKATKAQKEALKKAFRKAGFKGTFK